VLSSYVKGLRAELRDFRVSSREVADPFLKARFQRQLKDKKYKYLQQLSMEIKNSNSRFIAEAANKSRAAWSVLQRSIHSNKGRSLISELHLDGPVITDMRVIAEVSRRTHVAERGRGGCASNQPQSARILKKKID
jgi:hypothetical protein